MEEYVWFDSDEQYVERCEWCEDFQVYEWENVWLYGSVIILLIFNINTLKIF